MRNQTQGGCDHQDIHTHTNLLALDEGEGVHRYLAEFTLTCNSCGEPFGFRGLPCGLSTAGGAHVDPSAREMRVVLYSPSELALLGPLPGLMEQPDA